MLAKEREKQSEFWSFDLGNDPTQVAPMAELIASQVCEFWRDRQSKQAAINMALQEALSNAVHHGNLGLSSGLREGESSRYWELAEVRRTLSPWKDRSVYVEVEATGEDATITITDEGDGFDHNAVRSCSDGSGLFKVHGRGITMIRELMDSVEYSNGGRTITMLIRRN